MPTGLKFESARKKVIGKPYEGKLHVRFDEGGAGGIKKRGCQRSTLHAGKNVIFTNHLDWSDKRIIQTYRKMYKVENQFTLLHGALLIPIKPIYHWTDQKIKAHIFLCMVALLFAKTLEHVCMGKIIGNFRDILEFAGTVRIALVQREGKPQLVFEDMTLKQQAMMEAFSLSRFARI